MKKNNAFKKGIFTGSGFPGIGMSAAMFGFVFIQGRIFVRRFERHRGRV